MTLNDTKNPLIKAELTKYYRIEGNDQPASSWLLFEPVNPALKRPKRPEIPTTVRKLLGRPASQIVMKPQYDHLRCKTCGRYDSNEIFDAGFKDPVSIRIKGDFSRT